MKIRTRIAIWIAAVALLTGVGFSGYVVYDLLEVPYQLLDNELQRMAQALSRLAETAPAYLPQAVAGAVLPFPADQYWIKISDPAGRPLYQSRLAALIPIDTGGPSGFRSLEKTIPKKVVDLDQDSEQEVMFRVLTVRREGGPWTSLVIAKPIENLETGVQDLLLEISAALAFFVLLVVAASYFLAGQILQPIVRINRTAREIGESSLDRRIPLNSNHDELHDLAVSLNLMFDRLQFSFARQKEFIGNAAHELKSPITLLLLSHEELLQANQLPEQAHAELLRQTDTLRRMSRLVKNLLDLSRLEQEGKLQRRRVDLHRLLTGVAGEYEPLLHSRDIRVDSSLPPELTVDGDEEQLQRLFVNLLDNAWRYNRREDGRIRISGRRQDGTVTVEVANTGTGVPAAEAELVFEQFYRVDKSRSPTGGGSGLGLTIARTIARLHGGEITLASAPDGWTRVTVVLPAATGN